MNLRSKTLFAFATILAVSCGKVGDTCELSYKLYDPHEYSTLLINKVDSREIKVFVIGEENNLFQNIDKAISMWTAPLPTGSIRTRFVTSLGESDLVVEVVSPLAGRRQFTTLMPNNRPVITLFDNHNKTVLLHEMGHAFGMNDTYVAYHDGRTGTLTSTCDLFENQPESIMCLGGNGQYKLYPDDSQGIQNLYANRLR